MIKLYKKVVVVLLLCFSYTAFSQQTLQNNFYNQNPFAINPAAAGINGNVIAFLDYRDQWSGLKGAPETISFDLHGLITSSMGLGLSIKQNKTGIFNQFSIDLDYSYRIAIQNSQSLAFGVLVGFSQNKINQSEVIIANEADPALYSSNIIDEALVRAGFGIHYNWQNLDVYFSTPLLYGMQEKAFLQNAFGLVSYDFYVKGDIWKIQPSVLYQNNSSKVNQVDVNLTVEWDQRIWAMAGYRTNKNIQAGFGVSLKNLGIGYIYEINRSELSAISAGSHEIMLYFETPYSVTKKKPSYRSKRRRSSWN